MGMIYPVHRGIAYGDGHLAAIPGLKGQCVKLVGSDQFAVNTSPTTPTMGLLLNDYAVGQMPGVLMGPAVVETDVFEGDNIQPGDGLYCGANGKMVSGYDDATQAIKATKTLGASGKQVTVEALAGGTAGDSISVTLAGGTSKTLGVTVAGLDITVQLETDDTDAVLSTCAEIVAAINGDDDAKTLVRAATSNGNAVFAAAITKTQLAGGANAALRVGRVISITNGLMKLKLD